MVNPPSQIISAISIIALIISIFSFLICLGIAKNMEKRIQRESLFAEIISLYCEIREFSTKCKLFIQKIKHSLIFQTLGPLPSELDKCFADTNQVFLNAFVKADRNKLLQTKSALLSISSHVHIIMVDMEKRFHNFL